MHMQDRLLSINTEAIAENLRILRQHLPADTRLMVMVKSNGYGTQAIPLTKCLASQGIDIFGTACTSEAIRLREEGVKQAIFVLNVLPLPQEANLIVHHNLEPGISDIEVLEALHSATIHSKPYSPIRVHLHVSSGFNRFGCRPENALELAKKIQSCPNIILDGVMTHFAAADDPSQDPFTYSQIQQLDTLIDDLSTHNIPVRWRHAANSSGILRFHLPKYNMARAGLAVLGYYPSEATRQATLHPLHPALTLQARIVKIQHCKQGETISYGRQYRVKQKEERIAVVSLGYGDGIHRRLSGRGFCLVRGKRVPMIGSICMDYLMISLSEVPEAHLGDPVIFFGEDEQGNRITVEEVATWAETIPYEILTSLSPRITRYFYCSSPKRNLSINKVHSTVNNSRSDYYQEI